jgi:hypothetical protein
MILGGVFLDILVDEIGVQLALGTLLVVEADLLVAVIFLGI